MAELKPANILALVMNDQRRERTSSATNLPELDRSARKAAIIARPEELFAD